MFFDTAAAEAGSAAAAAVISGAMSPEEAGDLWLKYANASHSAGQAFLEAYDATGADR